MDRYNRAYRDPKSPLTPLTPLSSLNVFNFNKAEEKFTPSCPKRNADHFLKIRNVFEQKQCQGAAKARGRKIPSCSPVPLRLEVPQVCRPQCPAKMNYRQASPVAHRRCLSPRTESLLCRMGMQKYCPLFQREEIDIEVFRNLRLKDLHDLGIDCAEDQRLILHAAEFAYEFY